MQRLAGKRVYIDSNVFIFFGENHPLFAGPIESVFERASAGSLFLVTSELTLAEVLVLPMKNSDESRVSQYIEALTPRAYFDVIPVHRDILLAAARVRAAHRI